MSPLNKPERSIVARMAALPTISLLIGGIWLTVDFNFGESVAMLLKDINNSKTSAALINSGLYESNTVPPAKKVNQSIVESFTPTKFPCINQISNEDIYMILFQLEENNYTEDVLLEKIVKKFDKDLKNYDACDMSYEMASYILLRIQERAENRRVVEPTYSVIGKFENQDKHVIDAYNLGRLIDLDPIKQLSQQEARDIMFQFRSANLESIYALHEKVFIGYYKHKLQRGEIHLRDFLSPRFNPSTN